MALPPRLVEAAMGAGGPGMSAEEQMTEVQLPLMDDLPEGIMIAGDEEMVEGAVLDPKGSWRSRHLLNHENSKISFLIPKMK